MNKDFNLGMAAHQTLGFHSLMMRIPEREAVFWPGCALMNLDPELLEKTLEILRRAEPEIALATGCCGQPTVYLFPDKTKKRQRKLLGLLKKRGIKRIYTACPNCTLQLKELVDFEIISIWPVLAEHLKKSDVKLPEGCFIWHDPCPTRKTAVQQEGARKILAISGCDYAEPLHTGAKTQCCGNFHMMRVTDPEKSSRMRAHRLEELGEERIILSNCEGCLNAFRSEGRKTCHLLELLFGRSRHRSWMNRIKTTMKAPIR